MLKLIAIVAMTVDHLTWALFPGTQAVWYVVALHIIGRLTAPIMWFFIAEGCHYTHDRKKYAVRLFIFAVISHFAYDFAFGIPFLPLSTGVFNQTSVMWSLAWAAVLIFICRRDGIPQWGKILATVLICVISFPSDWSSIAVMAVYFIFLDKLYGALQMFTFLSVPVLAAYNGERGKLTGMKWFYYIYYPAHLVVIGIVRIALHGEIPIIF